MSEELTKVQREIKFIHQATDAINAFCKNTKDRQRVDLYDYLDKELEITIDRPAYDYNDQRIDDARFECKNKVEFDNVVNRVVRELEKKYQKNK